VTDPTPRLIPLDFTSAGYQRILGGPPGNKTLRSGLVQLLPGEDVGDHSTDQKEELIIVLEGEGALKLNGTDALSISRGAVAYCPPDTEHNVVNTGVGMLRYVYVVSAPTT
jgi:quercetin dioxygenase-like cupin family protein